MEGLDTEVVVLFSITTITVFLVVYLLIDKGILGLKKLGGYHQNQNRALNDQNQIERQQNIDFRDQDCLICLTEVVHRIILPCGHNFCGQCIMNIHVHNGKIDCPICRKSVNNIYIEFDRSKDPELFDEIQTYNEEYERLGYFRIPIRQAQRYIRDRFGFHLSFTTTTVIIIILLIPLMIVIPLLMAFLFITAKSIGLQRTIIIISKMYHFL
ncbi:unnamed protein product [Moneuplotes crassus]|uniref:RING-type domain-containing protein n=1 Tax=Euplotes crassus TaxID=5936 RepID=A0AAD2D6H2_EUPCR|nr:unnamed protein product [Moneuplotes crassus]